MAMHGGGRECTLFPSTLLWQPLLANPHEPRFFVKQTTLEMVGLTPVNDFGIGGTLALVRIAPADRPYDGWQLDVFAAAQTRFVEQDFMATVDYRFGIPVTFNFGRWSGKIGYEHTSAHLGDDIIVDHGLPIRDSVRDEIVLGLAYRVLEPLRVYGIFSYDFGHTFPEDIPPGPDRTDRYGLGAEWSRPLPTGWRGQPFAAVDLEFRGDQDYTPNLCVQAGWQWIATPGRPGARFVLEYYNGRSPFTQFLDRHETWFGVGLAFDY
jgi:hypothetical protein